MGSGPRQVTEVTGVDLFRCLEDLQSHFRAEFCALKPGAKLGRPCRGWILQRFISPGYPKASSHALTEAHHFGGLVGSLESRSEQDLKA